MSLPKPPRRRLSSSALPMFGLGSLLCMAGLAWSQQPIQLGQPEMAIQLGKPQEVLDVLPTVLPSIGEPVSRKMPIASKPPKPTEPAGVLPMPNGPMSAPSAASTDIMVIPVPSGAASPAAPNVPAAVPPFPSVPASMPSIPNAPSPFPSVPASMPSIPNVSVTVPAPGPSNASVPPIPNSPAGVPPLGMIESPSEDPHPLPTVLKLPVRVAEKRAENYLEHVVVPEQGLDLVVGIPGLMILSEPVQRVQVGGGDDRTSPVTFEVSNQRELSLLGRKVGRTVLNMWFADPVVPGRQRIVSYLVRVLPDTQWCRDMEKLLQETFPQSHVELKIAGNSLLVTGQARNAHEAAQIMKVVQPAPQQPSAPHPQLDKDDPAHKSMYQEPELEQRLPLQAVNLLQVPGEQLVLLRVMIAEVHRSAFRRLGVNPGDTNQPSLVDTFQMGQSLGNLKRTKLARSLYETTLVAGNGQAAKLQEGGSFPVPSSAAGSSAGVQYIPFGVSMTFVPTISDKEEIMLSMEGEVNSRDFGNRARINGSFVPSLSKRGFQSKVEVREGQTLAVAGVTQNSYGNEGEPFLGKLPLVGGMFNKDRSVGEYEMIIMITPEVLRPSGAVSTPAAPSPPVMSVSSSSRVEPVRVTDPRSFNPPTIRNR
jgi:pilus assembly protein CpaC